MFSWNDIGNFKLIGWYKKWWIEKWFQTEFSKYMRSLWYIVYHIQDIWYAYKFLDLFFIDNEWICRFIELKRIHKDSFNISQFEESQVILMRELDRRNPDICRVAIYSVKANDYKIFKFSELWNIKNEKWWIKLWGATKLTKKR